MSREVTEAHYLHERSGLEAVIRPPIRNPTALRWVPKREELVVGTRDGEVALFDPVLGTKSVLQGVGGVAAIDIHQDRQRIALATREGRYLVGTLRGEVQYEGRHPFVGGMEVLFAERHLMMVGDGDEPDTRSLLILNLDDGVIKPPIRLPPRVTPTLSPTGSPLLCRSVPAGLVVVPLRSMHSLLRESESTAHRLRATGQSILGFTSTGVCVWGQEGGVPRSMRLPDLTAGDLSADGRYLGLGTRNGAVALARMDRIEKRVRPDLVRDVNAPVIAVAFSDKGKWMATAAEALRIWSWED
jgi:hypothetical protein